MRQKTILIFGLSSFVGSNLAQILGKHYRIVGTTHKTKVDFPNVLSIPCDITKKELVEKIVYIFKPDITIYAIGLTNIQDCHDYPKVADALNNVGVYHASLASERYGSKFIYFSSCFVFPGEDVMYRENDHPLPLTTYGITQVSSEFYIQKSCLNYLLFRIPPLIGRSFNPNQLTWFEYLERKNFLGEKISCDSKIYTNYLDIWTLAEIVHIAIEEDFTNRLFQVASKDKLNRYQFAEKFMTIFEGSEALLQKSDWVYPKLEEQLSLANVTDQLYLHLDVFNVEDTFGIEMPTIQESLLLAKRMLGYNPGKRKSKTSGGGVSFI